MRLPSNSPRLEQVEERFVFPRRPPTGSRSCVASLIIVRRVWGSVKARRANSRALAFRCQQWLLMSPTENTVVRGGKSRETGGSVTLVTCERNGRILGWVQV